MKKLQEKLEQSQKLRAETEQKIQILNEKKYAEIKIIEDKYKDELNELDLSFEALNVEFREIYEEERQINVSNEWNEAKVQNEINEFYLMSMLKKINVDIYWIEEIKHKQTLFNGLSIWMIIDTGPTSAYKLYLAFDKSGLVGTSYRLTSKHAGDETTAFSFIGQFDKPLKTEVKNPYNESFYYSNTTFQGWIRELKKLKEADFSPLPMNGDTLEEIRAGLQDYWSEYSWERKLKTSINPA